MAGTLSECWRVHFGSRCKWTVKGDELGSCWNSHLREGRTGAMWQQTWRAQKVEGQDSGSHWMERCEEDGSGAWVIV